MKNEIEWVTPGYEEEVEKWSQIIRKFRKVMGWTQGRLAKEIGITYTSLNKYENERALPAMYVREGIKGLFRRTFRGLEPEDVIEMDESELQKIFLKETEKKNRKPEIIIRRRSPEMAQQMKKPFKKT
jgi:DNA-binding XRE family transcriptional regulator